MRPTAADALDGAERLLRSLVAEGDLTQDDAEPVLTLLRQARVPAGRLAFLAEDNRVLLALLDDLRPALPGDLAADVTSRLASQPPAPLLDVEEADRLNASLRELLAGAVRALPVGTDRERVRSYLLDRLQREPG